MDHSQVVSDIVQDIFAPVAFEGEASDSLLLWLQREYSKVMRREANARREEGKGRVHEMKGEPPAPALEKRHRSSPDAIGGTVDESNFRWGDQ